ncbi:hypothetical protein L228DRAFT_243927 [Xylona heveae TC161]|uniref:Transglycosylase SLT domain-containing protein n=1 Tax=Xylona heveae (strain CBS 132557 / TC161) TaxID=1328760 RepID=A0A165IN33_XYLHT|nr:hypothetical protein L228DRAFT_243927 [Xylona heveae TC161]KZF25135.1 hypothetical protein L228DRAFT_243927 [Xylona heveae TC161]
MFVQSTLPFLCLVALAAAFPVPSPENSENVENLEKRNGAGSTVAASAGLAWYTSDANTGVSGYADPSTYQCFSGPASNFPDYPQWMDYTQMFDLNQRVSLSQLESGPIQGNIWDAIQTVSSESMVDPRLILAVIMQESTGNVNVPCTNNGVENCGLMQAFAGSVSFDPSDSLGSITQMIRDGTQGTAQGPGLVQWLNSDSETSYAGNTDGSPYNAVRGYNSGSIDFTNLSNRNGATASYVSDIANRLLGWDGNGAGSSVCGF